MTAPFVILGCGERKRNLAPGETCRAIDLYTGPLYQSRRAYAEALGGPHRILSGLYGLIPPDRLIPTYNLALADEPEANRRTWATMVEAALRSHPVARAGETAPVVVLASGLYLEPFAWLGDRLIVPAKGLPIGGQRAELGRLTRELRAPGTGPTVEDELAWFDRHFAAIGDGERVELSAGAIRALLARRVA